MRNSWLWVWLAVVNPAQAGPAPMDSIERRAKLYLHACITAVLPPQLDLPEGIPPAAWNGTSCADPAFKLASSPAEPTPPAIRHSRIEFGTQWTDGFRVVVTDRLGRSWTGGPDSYPKVSPSPSFPVEQVQAAQQVAQDTFAQNYLRGCFLALSEMAADSPLTEEWEGRSCAEPSLNLPMPAAGQLLPQSVIHHRPKTEEGVEVVVTSASGQIHRLPEHSTPLPPPALRDTPAYQFGVRIAAMIGLAATLLFLTFVPGSRSAAVMGTVLGVPGGLLLWAVLRSPQLEWAGLLIAMVLLVWIGAGVLGSVPRLAYRAGRERWWEALGNSLIWALLPSPSLSFLYFMSAEQVFGVPYRSGWAALVILLAIVGFALSRRHRVGGVRRL